MVRRSNHDQAKWYIANTEKLSDEQIADAMTYKWFRLNTMYFIKDKHGKKCLFSPNEEQEKFYLDRHYRSLILKARQLGFTTFEMISNLDSCLFVSDFSAGCICHNLDSAKDIYRNKIKYAYQNITDDVKYVLNAVGYDLPLPLSDKDNSYVFSNGSSIKVSTSYRGGTLQSLHISEFGNICKKFPEKSKEIVTGAFEAVASGGRLTIESTADGKSGYFYDYSTQSKKDTDSGVDLSPLDFKFHFFPWWTRAEYSVDGRISNALYIYFDELKAKYGISLSGGQKAWYSAKWKNLGDDMKREYPSTPDEAFEQSIEGAYYSKQFAKIYEDKRIGNMPGNDAPVHTAWDLGVGDSTSIWFYQKIGNMIHVIDFYENSGEGLRHYFKVLKDKGYRYGEHYAPHDIAHREFGSDAKSRIEIAQDGLEIDGELYKIYFNKLDIMSIDEGIELAREILGRCAFDSDKTEEGVKCLESYRKEWNDKLGCWRDRPLHDWASHAADAFRYLAMAESTNTEILTVPFRNLR